MRTLLASLLLLSAVPASACQVPVFRYGLDHWQPAAFIVQVPRDRIDDIDWLYEVTDRPDVAIDVEVIDGDAFRVLAPYDPTPLWRGELDAERLRSIAESPARRELAKRLLAGDSVVWVYVGGDGPEDETHLELLRKRVRLLEQRVELPEIDPNDPASKIGPGPRLALRFSVLHVQRDDPAEQWFVRLLGGPSHAEVADGPFVAPVFARGRVLSVLPAEFVDEAVLDEACFYLAGACSCQVKDQNPGWDLLVAVDWEEGLWAADEQRLAAVSISDVVPRTGVTAAEPEPETVVFGPRSSEPTIGPADTFGLSAMLLALVSGSVFLAMGGRR